MLLVSIVVFAILIQLSNVYFSGKYNVFLSGSEVFLAEVPVYASLKQWLLDLRFHWKLSCPFSISFRNSVYIHQIKK